MVGLLLPSDFVGRPGRSTAAYDVTATTDLVMCCFRKKPFEDLIQKAKIVSDPTERTKLYEQAQIVFKEQAPWATIAHSVVFKPIRKEVKDFKIDPFGGHIFYGVDIEE